jgi:glycosyltransferase involved in cell wall biosynthesis
MSPSPRYAPPNLSAGFIAPDDMDVAVGLRESGLFLADWYCDAYPDVAATGLDALEHFCRYGRQAKRRPNPYFDPDWYLEKNQDVKLAGHDPLVHYWQYGEREGRRPIFHFDPAWYRQVQPVDEGQSALAHFLRHRHSGRVSPLPEFDAEWYIRTYEDVARAAIDPFEHYLHQGFREDRNPSETFDTRYYRSRYLSHEPDQNPLLHYLANRHRATLHPRRPAHEPSIPAAVRASTSRGPYFEDPRPLPAMLERQARVLAYYLPQFHAIPENDAWWGAGFTEWTNVARALPRFEGHYQPRVPRDLGHYDLSNTDVLRRQIAMAQSAGVFGFVFYFYWFNGRRLLDRPLEALLATPALDMPFCLMWANENWTRRWDGSDEQVLISQDYRSEDEAGLLACFARHFADRRYIRLQGRPLLMLYRPRLIPDAAATVRRWRSVLRKRHGEEPIFVMSQSFGDRDPAEFGLDGAIEFPPHKLVGGLTLKNPSLTYLDSDCTGQVYDYDDVVAASLSEPPPSFPLIKTATPSWDNDARRQGAGLVLRGSTPAKYEAWVAGLIDHAQRHRFFGEALICINAWNEWAEGAYLEPDQHFGSAYLNATSRAVAGLALRGHRHLLLVGHDAFPAGAQLLLLRIGRQLQRVHGVRVSFLLLDGGRLLPDYQAEAATVVAASVAEQKAAIDSFYARGCRTALVNTAAASPAADALAARGIAVTLLLHELPVLLAQRGLTEATARAAGIAQRVVFACAFVRERVLAHLALTHRHTALLPQGVWRPTAHDASARRERRAALGLKPEARLIIGAGHGDLRKGFDLFLQVWRCAERADGIAHCVWLGEIDPMLRQHLAAEIALAEASGTFHLPGWQDPAAGWLSAADVFVLPSREDPYPSAALEAVAAGLPCVAFDGAGGIPDLLRRHDAGTVVPLGDAEAMAGAALSLARTNGAVLTRRRERLAQLAEREFSFDRYVGDLLRLAQPTLLAISVVVPNYNYARFLRQRLASIFSQTYPVLEIIVLDDASGDASVATAQAVAAELGRDIRLVQNARNSGSAFAQWRRGAELARGDYLWIAEADDTCDPHFLETLVRAIARAPDAVLAFSDSRSIDAESQPIWPNYKPYYAEAVGDALAGDASFTAADFLRRCLSRRNLILNASAVLWRRQALVEACERCAGEMTAFRMAGDWRLYVEVLQNATGSVAYAADPVNAHRRHGASITGRQSRTRHVQEVQRVQKVLARHFAGDVELLAGQESYRARLAEQLVVPRSARPTRQAADSD